MLLKDMEKDTVGWVEESILANRNEGLVIGSLAHVFPKPDEGLVKVKKDHNADYVITVLNEKASIPLRLTFYPEHCFAESSEFKKLSNITLKSLETSMKCISFILAESLVGKEKAENMNQTILCEIASSLHNVYLELRKINKMDSF